MHNHMTGTNFKAHPRGLISHNWQENIRKVNCVVEERRKLEKLVDKDACVHL
jgi:hypothetical protein